MRLSIATVAAALGYIVHNLVSLPLPLLAPETVGPLAVYLGLLVWHLRSRGAPAARAALVSWTAINLVIGGILSALPLPLWPFVPEPTLRHYLAHMIYTLAQLPLLWLLVRSTGVPASA